MKRRFVKERDCIDGSTVIPGNGPLFIKVYDIVTIKVDTSIEKNSMMLLNVIYVLDFMINIIVGSILEDKGLHFDIQYRHLHRNDSAVFLVLRIRTYYVLEGNRISEGVAAFATFIWADSTHDWHKLLTHCNNEAIQHLTTVVEGMKFTDKESVLKINKCEECVLSKAYRIVSRFFEKSEISQKTFFDIIYDFVVMSTIMNKDQWISHVTCSTIGFHMIYTHLSKAQVIETLIRVIHIIGTRYEGKVVFVRSDGERVLESKWNTYIVMKRIIFESSATDISVQNEHSERMGGVLLMKSRARRIQAGLSIYLWYWTTQTVDYIMNRTLLVKHLWKILFEMVTDKKLNLAHIVQYGTKTYFVDKEIFNLEKIRAKAYIGFLVGYNSKNIWFIWISNQRKVVRTRDITFDENSQYGSYEIDAAQSINESFLCDDTLKISAKQFHETQWNRNWQRGRAIWIRFNKNYRRRLIGDGKSNQQRRYTRISVIINFIFFEGRKHFTNDVVRASVIFWAVLIVRRIVSIGFCSFYTLSLFSNAAQQRKHSVKRLNSLSQAQSTSSTISHCFRRSFNRRKTSILRIICGIVEEGKETSSKRAFIRAKILSSNP